MSKSKRKKAKNPWKQFTGWFKKKYKLNKALKLKNIYHFYFIIPLLSYLYLATFFRHFNISYFLYFSPADALMILYAKSTVIILIAFLIFPLALIPLIPLALKWMEGDKKITNRGMILVSLGALILILLVFFLIDGDLSKTDGKYAFVLYCMVLVMLYTKRAAFYLFFCFLLVGATWQFSKSDARRTEERMEKYTFDLVLKDGEKKMVEGDSCVRFVGNTSNFVFTYNRCTEKMSATPVDEIKEIRFDAKLGGE